MCFSDNCIIGSMFNERGDAMMCGWMKGAVVLCDDERQRYRTVSKAERRWCYGWLSELALYECPSLILLRYLLTIMPKSNKLWLLSLLVLPCRASCGRLDNVIRFIDTWFTLQQQQQSFNGKQNDMFTIIILFV